MEMDDYAMRKTRETIEKSIKLAEAAAREYQKISAQQQSRAVEMAIAGMLEALNKEVNNLDRYLSGKDRQAPAKNNSQRKGSLGLSFDEACAKARTDALTQSLEKAGKSLEKGLGKENIGLER